MFPEIFTEESTEEEESTENIGVDFAFNYETGQHLTDNGSLQMCDDIESIRQYIQNVLRTEAKVHKVYTKGENDVFGISLFEYIGNKSLPLGYINSELKREVTELLLKHPQISDVTSWKSEKIRRGLNISFTVTLTDGRLIKTTENITEVAYV